MKPFFLFGGTGLVVLVGGFLFIKSASSQRNAEADAADSARAMGMVASRMVEFTFPPLERDCQGSPQALQQIQALKAQYQLANQSPVKIAAFQTQAKAAQTSIAALLPVDKAARFNSDYGKLLSSLDFAVNPRPIGQ